MNYLDLLPFCETEQEELLLKHVENHAGVVSQAARSLHMNERTAREWVLRIRNRALNPAPAPKYTPVDEPDQRPEDPEAGQLYAGKYVIHPMQLPERPTLLRDSFKRILWCNDVHVPFHHQVGWRLFLQVVAYAAPEVFVINGDFLDAYALSRFAKDPRSQE